MLDMQRYCTLLVAAVRALARRLSVLSGGFVGWMRGPVGFAGKSRARAGLGLVGRRYAKLRVSIFRFLEPVHYF